MARGPLRLLVKNINAQTKSAKQGGIPCISKKIPFSSEHTYLDQGLLTIP